MCIPVCCCQIQKILQRLPKVRQAHHSRESSALQSPMNGFLLAGCRELEVDEGTSRQVPGCGISGSVQGVSVSVGSQNYVTSQLDWREQQAANRFLEASTSQTAGNMQVKQCCKSECDIICCICILWLSCVTVHARFHAASRTKVSNKQNSQERLDFHIRS